MCAAIVLFAGASEAKAGWCHINLQSQDNVHVGLDYQMVFTGAFLADPLWANVSGGKITATDEVVLYVRSAYGSYEDSRVDEYQLRWDASARKFTGELKTPGNGISTKYPDFKTTQRISVTVNGRTLMDPIGHKPFFVTNMYAVHSQSNCWR